MTASPLSQPALIAAGSIAGAEAQASWIVVLAIWSTGPGAAPRPAGVGWLRGRGRGVGSAIDGPSSEFVGTLQLLVGDGDFSGPCCGTSHRWATAACTFRAPGPRIRPAESHGLSRLPACASLIDWAATTACAVHGVRCGPDLG